MFAAGLLQSIFVYPLFIEATIPTIGALWPLSFLWFV